MLQEVPERMRFMLNKPKEAPLSLYTLSTEVQMYMGSALQEKGDKNCATALYKKVMAETWSASEFVRWDMSQNVAEETKLLDEKFDSPKTQSVF